MTHAKNYEARRKIDRNIWQIQVASFFTGHSVFLLLVTAEDLRMHLYQLWQHSSLPWSATHPCLKLVYVDNTCYCHCGLALMMISSSSSSSCPMVNDCKSWTRTSSIAADLAPNRRLHWAVIQCTGWCHLSIILVAFVYFLYLGLSHQHMFQKSSVSHDQTWWLWCVKKLFRYH